MTTSRSLSHRMALPRFCACRTSKKLFCRWNRRWYCRLHWYCRWLLPPAPVFAAENPTHTRLKQRPPKAAGAAADTQRRPLAHFRPATHRAGQRTGTQTSCSVPTPRCIRLLFIDKGVCWLALRLCALAASALLCKASVRTLPACPSRHLPFASQKSTIDGIG